MPFHAQLIKAGPVMPACKTAKLFKFSLINSTWTHSSLVAKPQPEYVF